MSSISVIVPCYNCALTIERCVGAVLGGTVVPDEIVLVDDCSTDGATRAKLSALAERHRGRVKTVLAPKNLGPARARNAGAKIASGEYLFFLDSDTEVLPDALANCLHRVAKSKCDAVVGIYDAAPLNGGPSPWYKALLYAWLLGRRGAQPYDQFSASCSGISAAAFRALGGFDEWFPAGLDFENEEFGHRIASRYKMMLDPAVRAGHHFPHHRKMALTFFHRAAFWAEMFVCRRRFSATANTAGMGLASMALLGAVALLPLALLHPLGALPAAASFAIYAVGYRGFFAYVWRRRRPFLPLAVALNLYYTLIVDLGAVYGLCKVLTGRSLIARRFRSAGR